MQNQISEYLLELLLVAKQAYGSGFITSVGKESERANLSAVVYL